MKRLRNLILQPLLLMAFAACSPSASEEEASSSYQEGTFGYDLQFLQKYDTGLVVLQGENQQAGVLVSPKYQGKVFTSTAGGNEGHSYGWINYELIASGKKLDHMNGYGGEDRFWLGPEGGQFSVFFKPGAEMVYENWYTPAAIDTEPFELLRQDSNSVQMQKTMQLQNYSGHTFHLLVDRTITLLSASKAADILGTTVPEAIDFVGYESKNSITNTGDSAWTRDTGTVSIWILGMFRPSPTATVVVPYQQGNKAQLGTIATTDYFGEIGPDRISMENGILYFKVDGQQRGKLGLAPGRAKDIAGSYDEANQVLTLVQYSLPKGDKPYVNQRWEQQEEPFKGDVMNAYNDGPLEDGSQMGPFYEIESSSPAAFLKPDEKLTHYHRTFHFSGEEEQLDQLARGVLGVGIENIKKAFE